MEPQPKTILIALIAAALLIALSSCVPTASPTPTHVQPPTPTSVPLQSRIAFLSVRPAGMDPVHRETLYTVEIHTMNLDGSNIVNVSSPLTNASAPAWSPDGKRIAFRGYYDEGQTWRIYVVNTDGSNLTRLPSGPGSPSGPVWSPDGEQVAFRAGDGIRVIRLDRPVEPELSIVLAKGRDPSWSPEGTKIAYEAPGADGKDSVWVMNADGSGKQELARGMMPDWAPSGTKIAFVAETRPGLMGRDICSINSDGSGLTNITNSPAMVWMPSWSPDGSRIAYRAQDPLGTQRIYVMNLDGSNRITTASFATSSIAFPSWSPDGRQLTFAIPFGDDIRGTYAVNVDSSDLHRIIVDGIEAVWSPWLKPN